MTAIAGVTSCASSRFDRLLRGEMIIGAELIDIRVSIRVINALSYPLSVLSLYTTNFSEFIKSTFIAMRLLNNGRKRVEISISYRRNSIVD